MSHGKKFTAAEKHFHKKEEQLNRQLKDAIAIRDMSLKKQLRLETKLQELETENAQLKAVNAELQRLSGLSDDDVRTLLKRAEALNSLGSILNIVNSIT